MTLMFRLAATALLATSLLAGCSGGPVRRVSEPAAAIQQLSVRADGSWELQVRLNNYSSIPMQFDQLELAVTVAGQDAGTAQAAPDLRIGPESADVATLVHAPGAAARMAMADALAAGRGIDYTLRGSVHATPEESRQRTYTVTRSSRLTPVPGLPGVLR